jgi:two-component system chemotaxis response regulator CheY
VVNDLETDVHLSLVPPQGQHPTDRADEVDTEPSSAVEAMRVLIVDDAPSTRRFLRAVLEHCRDFDVVGEAGDGNTAVEQAKALRPDLVLLDLSMPTMDGATALKEILRVSPQTLVIVVSGMNPMVSGMMLDAGATAFVSKGLSPLDLLDRLGAILGRRISIDSLAGSEPDRGAGKATPEPTPTERRAVVFESDDSVRDLITQALEGCEVDVVAETGNASTALAVVDLAQPELVVLELSSDDALGTSIVTEACRRSPRSVVVVYSKLEERRNEALAAGAAAFVVKPRIDELAKRIRQLIPSRLTLTLMLANGLVLMDAEQRGTRPAVTTSK